MDVTTIRITGPNQFSEPIDLGGHERFAVSVHSAAGFSGTVLLQRSFDRGITWRNLGTYTDEAEDDFETATPCQARIGCITHSGGGISAELRSSGIRR